MSKPAAPRRLYTPRTSRGISLRLDPETVGQSTEAIARFFGTGRYLLSAAWPLGEPIKLPDVQFRGHAIERQTGQFAGWIHRLQQPSPEAGGVATHGEERQSGVTR